VHVFGPGLAASGGRLAASGGQLVSWTTLPHRLNDATIHRAQHQLIGVRGLLYKHTVINYGKFCFFFVFWLTLLNLNIWVFPGLKKELGLHKRDRSAPSGGPLGTVELGQLNF